MVTTNNGKKEMCQFADDMSKEMHCNIFFKFRFPMRPISNAHPYDPCDLF